MRGGGFQGGGGFRGGGFRGGGFNNGGFRGGFNRGYGFRGFSNFGYYPYGLYGGLWYDPFWSDFWNSDNSYPDYSYPYQYPYSGYGGSSGPSVMIISNTPYAYPAPAVIEPPEIISAPAAPAPPTQSTKYEEPLYLIASHDGTIRAVLAYWVEGMTVHYVTMDHQQREMPLTSIDRPLSDRLNRERNVTFRLPG